MTGLACGCQAESRLSGAQLVVESLSRELAELRSCESLSNVRLQHECVVSGLSQRFEAELQELRQRLDGAGHAVLERVALHFFDAHFKHLVDCLAFSLQFL